MHIIIKPAKPGTALLADVELHFVSGPLAGLKLIGFGIVQPTASSPPFVTFPSRQYRVNEERGIVTKSFALLRPIVGPDYVPVSASFERLRDRILQAYSDHLAGIEPGTRHWTYGQLPERPAPGVMLLCPDCTGEYSATRGDYFLHEDHDLVICGQCETPLQLVQRSITFELMYPERAR